MSKASTTRDDTLRVRLLRGVEHARRLWERHAGLNRAAEIVRAQIDLMRRGERTALATVRARVERRGGFLQSYRLDELKQRLVSDHWLVVEAQVQHEDCWVPAADCQLQLPEDRPGSSPVVDLPQPQGDVVRPRWQGLAREIADYPARAALAADLCAEDWAQGRRVASLVKHTAFERVRKLNLSRQYPIRYVLGQIFRVRGLRLPNGESVFLDQYGESSLENVPSRRTNEHSRRSHGDVGWELREREVSVVLPEDGGSTHYSLILDWIVIVHDLDAPVR